ncbi:MAG: FkbM family methyltransferase [Rhodobacteraceae bacterium]|nr:FkbM family methyltransferase [Paracoccaceae bacterium]
MNGGEGDSTSAFLHHTKSQIYQDIFVLATLNFKENGYFVEFGAANGVGFSNTYLLEKKFGWNGILSEPSKGWHQELTSNRNAHIDFDCVWHTSNEQVKFWEFPKASYLSGIPFGTTKPVKRVSKSKIEYTVNTVSLNDLLERYDAPKEIDYLSIDAEGTEFEIIQNFDFKKYKIAVITIEPNENREEIFTLLSSYGYRRVLESVSMMDDWYVLG